MLFSQVVSGAPQRTRCLSCLRCPSRWFFHLLQHLPTLRRFSLRLRRCLPRLFRSRLRFRRHWSRRINSHQRLHQPFLIEDQNASRQKRSIQFAKPIAHLRFLHLVRHSFFPIALRSRLPPAPKILHVHPAHRPAVDLGLLIHPLRHRLQRPPHCFQGIRPRLQIL